jgi:RNA polymerase sigma-70 factor (ECF subfamily)
MAIAQGASSAVRLEPAASVAAERLFQQHSGWLYGYCLRLLRSPEEAEDAVQATYLNACRSLKDGFEPRADSAWLLKVAQNVCLTRLRSAGRRARVERPQDAEVLADTAAAPAREADELIGLPDALATLPAQQRQAILLREWQGLSYKEVGAELGLSQAAVETLIFRARRSLASALENPERRRKRALYSADGCGLAAALKSLLGGGAAVKLAAVAAVATTATVVAADPVGWHRPAAADPPAAETTVVGGAERTVPGLWSQNVADDRAERRFFAAPAGGPPSGRAGRKTKPDSGRGAKAHGRAAEPRGHAYGRSKHRPAKAAQPARGGKASRGRSSAAPGLAKPRKQH